MVYQKTIPQNGNQHDEIQSTHGWFQLTELTSWTDSLVMFSTNRNRNVDRNR